MKSTAYICTGWLVFAIGSSTDQVSIMFCSVILFIAGAVSSNDN
ncbi:TMhelix containing protein [Vibrio phage 1.201.B._10N.286.55.F1]|nr:TMhelix containing protein [Vibrio phage 1.201.B._10N.286.55.F1]